MIAEADRDTQSKVHRIFVDRLEVDVDVDTDVIESGILDSLAFVQLLIELEQEFGVKIDVATLELDDFSSVSRIARFVATNGNGEA